MTDLVDLEATVQARLIRSGELSARELLEASLVRIEATNPEVNAVVTLDVEAAQAAAAAADEVFVAGRTLGPLHGLTLAVKDMHATAGMRTTSGSPIFADHVPEADELIVARMRAAGAVIVGKTNVPEFAAGSHTFNPVFGVTRNPYALDRSAGGSSGGAAAALAAGMVSLADGSDMGGSLRNPASFCNVVGHRPSPGRVPTWPSGDPWTTLWLQGPMGRTVADTALLLSVQAGPDPRPPLSLSEPGSVFLAELPTGLEGRRIAVSPDLGGAVMVDPEVAAMVEAQAEVLRGLGASVEMTSLDFAGAEEVFRTFRGLLMLTGLGGLLEESPDLVKQTIHENVAVGRGLNGGDIARATRLRTALYVRVQEFFADYDALVLPACQVLPFDASLEYPTSVAGVELGDYLAWMQAACMVTATECPATAVPVGFSEEGLPIGVQVVAAHRNDLGALKVAYALEQATRCYERRPALVGNGVMVNALTRLGPRSPQGEHSGHHGRGSVSPLARVTPP